MAIGAIDIIEPDGIGGWIAERDYSPYKGRLTLHCDGRSILLPKLTYSVRPDVVGKAGGEAALGFRVGIPPIFGMATLARAWLQAEDGSRILLWRGYKGPDFPPAYDAKALGDAKLLDPYFLRHYVSLPVKDLFELAVYVTNSNEPVISDPIFNWNVHSVSRIMRREGALEPRIVPVRDDVELLVRLNEFPHILAMDVAAAANLFRGALLATLYKTPFDYEKYIAGCSPAAFDAIMAHHEATGFDVLYCAYVQHAFSMEDSKAVGHDNFFGPDSVRVPVPPKVLEQLDQSGGFRLGSFKSYPLDFHHYVIHGQYEVARLHELVGPPAPAVFERLDKLRVVDPEIPDGRALNIDYAGRNRIQKVLKGCAKVFRAKAMGQPVGLVFMPWFSYGGSDKEALLLAQTIRDLAGDRLKLIFVLGQSGLNEFRLYEEGFDVIMLRPDAYLAASGIDKVIERLIVAENVKFVINSNSLDFWQYFTKFPALVAANVDVFTMTFCDDPNRETGSRDGWLRRFFKYLAPYNKCLLSDNDSHVEQYMKDHFMKTLATRTLFYPDAGQRRKTHYGIKGRPKVLWASRLDEQKGLPALIETARLNPDVEFHIYGSTLLTTDQKLPDMLRSLGNTVLHGEYKSFAQVPLADYDVFLYTSLWDGLPNILLEVGNGGLPIVTSLVGGISELVNESNAFTVQDARAADQYTAQLQLALSSEPQRRGRAEKLIADIGRKHSVAQFRQSVSDLFGAYAR